MYRIGVLGLDHWYWATMLIPHILKHPRLKLAAIYEPQTWRLTATKYTPERVVTSPAQITDADDIDIVLSLLPCPASARWLTRAAGHGKALICNKPLAMNLAAGKRLVAALRRTRKPSFSLEGPAALTRMTRFVQGIIRQGSIGRPLTGFSSMRGGMPQAWWDRGGKTGRRNWGWWTDPKLVPGGAWIDHSIYAIAEFRFLLGDAPVRVSATMANVKYPRARIGHEDYGIATYTYRRGTVVTMEYDWIGQMGSFHSIAGTKGACRWGLGVAPGHVELRTVKGVKMLKVPAWREETVLDHLVRCLDQRRETIQPAALGLDNLRLALAAYQASKSGRTVRV